MIDKHLIGVGDKITFVEEKQAYTVRARNSRFIVCTKPFNARKTVLYTIIDLERDVRGPCNLIFGCAMETDADIKEAMQLLQNHCDNKHAEFVEGVEVPASMEVSHRNCIPLVVKHIVKKDGTKWL